MVLEWILYKEQDNIEGKRLEKLCQIYQQIQTKSAYEGVCHIPQITSTLDQKGIY